MASDKDRGDAPGEVDEHLATVHESLVRLALSIPETVLLAVVKAAGIELDPRTTIRERNAQIQTPNLVRRAREVRVDALWTLHVDDGRRERIVFAVVFEVQTGMDVRKLLEWPLQATTAAAEFSTRGLVAVDILDPDLRRWYASKFIGSSGPKPAWIRASHVELITALEDARQRPLETIWGAVHHVQSRTARRLRVAGVRAALVALSVLDPRNRARYTELVLGTTPTALYEQARQEAELRGELGTRQLQELTGFERRGHSFCVGLKEGRAEGLAQGLRQTLLDIAELRGLAIDDLARTRISACDDVQTLERWRALVKRCPVEAFSAKILR